MYIHTFSGATASSGASLDWISFLGPVGLVTGGFHFFDDYQNLHL